MNKEYTVYRIRNKNTDKSYYGLSCVVQRRKNRHWNTLRKNEHHNQHLQNAWNKDGESSFEFVVEEDGLSKEQANNLEKMLIALDQDSYNKIPGGGLGPVGRRFGPKSEKVKQKIRESNRGQKRSEEARHNMREGIRNGKPRSKRGSYSDEHRAAISAGLKGVGKGRRQSPEHIQKRIQATVATKRMKSQTVEI